MKFAALVTIVVVFFSIAACAVAGEQDKPGEAKQPVDIAMGQSLYTENCAACHGANGAGDGVVAAVLKPTVPNLMMLCASHGGAFPAEHVYKTIDGRTQYVAHGSRLMPIWGMEFWLDEGADERADVRVSEKIHNLVNYLRTLAADCAD